VKAQKRMKERSSFRSERRLAVRREQAFEERITTVLRELGYRTERPKQMPNFGPDILAWKTDPLMGEVRLAVELKYYENSLVPLPAVRHALAFLDLGRFDRTAIVTTIGFTEESKSFAQESGKLSLLTEADLVRQLPQRQQKSYQRGLLEAGYIQFFISQSLREEKQADTSLIIRQAELPKDQLLQLVAKSVSPEELLDILVQRASKEAIVENLVSLLEPHQLEVVVRHAMSIESSRLKGKKQSLRESYERARSETDPDTKGKLFEKFFKELIVLVPDLSIAGSRINPEGIEEIDIQVWNENRKGVWEAFDQMIFVECKNWSGPVGSSAISEFRAKLDDHKVRAGIFVAMNRITGEDNGGAWGNVRNALKAGYKIVVLEGTDLDDILACVDVTDKVREKYQRIYQ